MSSARPSVLCVDDSRDLVEVVQAVLEDEGYVVLGLHDLDDDALLQTIGRLEPDAILLDGFEDDGYGQAWELAAAIRERPRPVPVIMLSAHALDVAEARDGTSERAVRAGFASIVSKPFHLDELIRAVALAVGHSEPFDRIRSAEQTRTRESVP